MADFPNLDIWQRLAEFEITLDELAEALSIDTPRLLTYLGRHLSQSHKFQINDTIDQILFKRYCNK